MDPVDYTQFVDLWDNLWVVLSGNAVAMKRQEEVFNGKLFFLPWLLEAPGTTELTSEVPLQPVPAPPSVSLPTPASISTSGEPANTCKWFPVDSPANTSSCRHSCLVSGLAASWPSVSTASMCSRPSVGGLANTCSSPPIGDLAEFRFCLLVGDMANSCFCGSPAIGFPLASRPTAGSRWQPDWHWFLSLRQRPGWHLFLLLWRRACWHLPVFLRWQSCWNQAGSCQFLTSWPPSQYLPVSLRWQPDWHWFLSLCWWPGQHLFLLFCLQPCQHLPVFLRWQPC